MEDNKYSRGKIYTIRCRTDDSLVYVGSTINELRKRWNGHKTVLNQGENQLIYQIVRENGGFDNWYIELLEKYPCKDCSELHKREGELIRQFGTINSKIAGRNKKEYYYDNLEKIKQYRAENREKLKEAKREWDLNNKERKAYHDKKYRNGIHREDILEQKKQQYKTIIETETPEQKRERLDRKNARRRELRQLKKQQQE